MAGRCHRRSATSQAADGLSDLGFSADEETVYRSLLRNPAATIEQLAGRAGLDPAAVARACEQLVELGVLKPDRTGRGSRCPGRPRRSAS